MSLSAVTLQILLLTVIVFTVSGKYYSLIINLPNTLILKCRLADDLLFKQIILKILRHYKYAFYFFKAFCCMMFTTNMVFNELLLNTFIDSTCQSKGSCEAKNKNDRKFDICAKLIQQVPAVYLICCMSDDKF